MSCSVGCWVVFAVRGSCCVALAGLRLLARMAVSGVLHVTAQGFRFGEIS